MIVSIIRTINIQFVNPVSIVRVKSEQTPVVIIPASTSIIKMTVISTAIIKKNMSLHCVNNVTSLCFFY